MPDATIVLIGPKEMMCRGDRYFVKSASEIREDVLNTPRKCGSKFGSVVVP